jgi:uncharacterized phage protein gp47/JayE
MNEYLSLFSGNVREKQRFMVFAAIVIGQVADLQAVVGEINGAFAPETAQGAQLDALGASLGLSRAETSAGVTATDTVFRDYIRKKLIRWGWDGTNGTVHDLAEKIKPGAVETDNQNGTVTVTGAGSQPADVKELFPVPAGIRTT